MSHQPHLSSIDLWSDHEQRCLDILRAALALLAGQAPDDNENDINRLLYRAIIRASHRLVGQGATIAPVVLEGRNPPVSTDKERTEREFKIPDFYWAFIDPLTNDPEDAAKQFVVECKRLTEPISTYTREYVKSGIVRFISEGHGYGKGVSSGVMVGYLQGVFLDDAYRRVVGMAFVYCAPPLSIRSRNGESGAEFVQEIERAFPVSPFRLTHLWARVGAGPVP